MASSMSRAPVVGELIGSCLLSIDASMPPAKKAKRASEAPGANGNGHGVERPPIDEADVLEYFDHAIALRRAIQFLRSHASCAINGTMGPHHPDPWDPMLSRVW